MVGQTAPNNSFAAAKLPQQQNCFLSCLKHTKTEHIEDIKSIPMMIRSQSVAKLSLEVLYGARYIEEQCGLDFSLPLKPLKHMSDQCMYSSTCVLSHKLLRKLNSQSSINVI